MVFKFWKNMKPWVLLPSRIFISSQTIVLAVLFSPWNENKLHGFKQQRKTRAEVRLPWEQYEFFFVLFWLFSYIYTRAKNRLLFGKGISRSCASLRTIRIRIYHIATRTQSERWSRCTYSCIEDEEVNNENINGSKWKLDKHWLNVRNVYSEQVVWDPMEFTQLIICLNKCASPDCFVCEEEVPHKNVMVDSRRKF